MADRAHRLLSRLQTAQERIESAACEAGDLFGKNRRSRFHLGQVEAYLLVAARALQDAAMLIEGRKEFLADDPEIDGDDPAGEGA